MFRLRSRLPIATVILGLAIGCDAAIDSRGAEIGSAVQLLGTARGELAEQSLRKLEELSGEDSAPGPAGPSGPGRSRVALPYLEAALHSANPLGRRNMVIALRRLGLAESAPLLGHIAAFDSDESTRHEAWQTLSLWAAVRKGERAGAASAAMRKVDEVRGSSSPE